jgi:hypothetical protein
MSLTGRFNFRRTFTGKVVLQVEEERRAVLSSGFRKRWRDAKVLDLAAPTLRKLIDLRMRPHYMPEVAAGTAPAPDTADELAATLDAAPPARPDGAERIVMH